MTRTLCLAVMFSLVAVTASGLDHPAVRVTFLITPGHQYDVFGAAGAQDIAEFVSRFREELASAFPLFDFRSTSQSAAHLLVRVDNDPIGGAAGPVNLVIAMEPEKFPDREPLVIELRAPGARGNPIGTPRSFMLEVGDRLHRMLMGERHSLVQKVLRHLPVAKTALCMAQQRMFVLPFTASELFIGEESRFEIRARDAQQVDWKFDAEPAGAAPATAAIPAPFRSKLRARVTGPPESLLQLVPATTLEPVGVYITKYFRQIEQVPVTPEKFNPAGGSQ